MKRSLFETILGAVVLIVAAVFLFFASSVANIRTGGGYEITAKFNKIGGLTTGNDVRISGVKVGTVKAVTLDDQNYQAIATLNIDNTVQLPSDTVAQVATEGLLGGYFLTLTPGIEEDKIGTGGEIYLTQPPVDLLDLLGRFIFSSASKDEGGEKGSAKAASPAPAALAPAAEEESAEPVEPAATQEPAATPEPAQAPAMEEEPEAEPIPQESEPAAPQTPAE